MDNIKWDNLTRNIKGIKVKDIMTKDVITVKENAHLAEVADFMIKSRISGLPVVNDSEDLIGIITATDLFILIDMLRSGKIIDNGEEKVFNPTVRFAMSGDVIKISPETNLEEVIEMMKQKNVHTLPVFEGEKMVGVIGRRDVLKNFYKEMRDLDL